MGTNHNTPAEIDPLTLKESQNLWHGFTVTAKYGVIAISILLLLMWFFLV